MLRLLLAAGMLAAVVAPAFAVCPRDGAVSKSSTVASQPSDDQTTPAPSAPASQKPS